MNERDNDAITVNVETDVDEMEVTEALRRELNVIFGNLYECNECGLVWGRKEASGRRYPDSGSRCPDCREERGVYQVNI